MTNVIIGPNCAQTIFNCPINKYLRWLTSTSFYIDNTFNVSKFFNNMI